MLDGVLEFAHNSGLPMSHAPNISLMTIVKRSSFEARIKERQSFLNGAIITRWTVCDILLREGSQKRFGKEVRVDNAWWNAQIINRNQHLEIERQSSGARGKG